MNWPDQSKQPPVHNPKISRRALRLRQARTCYEQGQLQEAERRCAVILAKRPCDFDALYLLGTIRHQQGQLSEALTLMAKALKTNGRSPELLINHGFILSRLKRFDEALESYDKTVEVRPDFAEAHNGRGCVLLDLQRPAEALDSFAKALTIRPRYAEALNNQGKAFVVLCRPGDAVSSLVQALHVQPDYAAAHYNLGNAFHLLGKPAAALASYDAALLLKPAYAEALSNRGVVLYELQRPDEAVASIDHALVIDPGYVEAHNSRGCLMLQLGRCAEATLSFGKALELRPAFPESHFNRGLLGLLLGDMTGGWKDYEWRWKTKDFAAQRRGFAEPQWAGQDSIDGKTILLHAEQGFGDTIQFARYVPLIAAMGAKVILEVQAPLETLLASANAIASVIGRGEPLPPFDFHCPLLSLPLAVNTDLETVPANVPYLRATAESAARWAARIPQSKSFRVGIAWSGSASHKNDRNRSIPLSTFAPLFAMPDVHFVSLQKDVRQDDEAAFREHPQFVDAGCELRDFEDAAGLVSTLDLTISVDTSVAHLAGALGRPVWILLPAAPDFRWLLDRNDSPWYPTARLFRQAQLGDWKSVIAEVRGELARHVRTSTNAS